MEKTYSYLRDFSAGINVKDAPNLIPDNALTEATNAVIGKGFVAKRIGYIAQANSPSERVAKWTDIGGKKWREL